MHKLSLKFAFKNLIFVGGLELVEKANQIKNFGQRTRSS